MDSKTEKGMKDFFWEMEMVTTKKKVVRDDHDYLLHLGALSSGIYSASLLYLNRSTSEDLKRSYYEMIGKSFLEEVEKLNIDFRKE